MEIFSSTETIVMGKLPLGKLSFGKMCIWEVAFGKLSLGKLPLGKCFGKIPPGKNIIGSTNKNKNSKQPRAIFHLIALYLYC